jgi:hypothetical protein
MRRLFAIAASVAILLALFAPAALAAEPMTTTGSVVVSVNGTVDVPAGGRLDAVVVVDGIARISGDVDAVVIVAGDATFSDATVGSLTVVNGSAELQDGTTILGDVRTFHGSVTQDTASTILGSVRTLDGDVASIAILLIPLLFLLFIGLILAGFAAALLVATFGARQVRESEALISGRPGHVLVAGIVGTVALPALAFLLMATVIGAPVGFGLLFVLLPALAFLGWIVAAIWIGDWLVASTRGAREPGRPYLAAILGVIVLGLAGIIPFVSAIATLFGFGAVLLAAWRVLRPEAPSLSAAGTPAGSPADPTRPPTQQASLQPAPSQPAQTAS